jgi:CheY-like chemotaxis protein
MDLRMPVMDGYEAIRQIKSTPRGKQSTIIALSASILDKDRETAFAAGCEAFLQKPFRDAEIFELLHRHLGVRFVYEEEQQTADSKLHVAREELLTPEALTVLPEELVKALQEALESIDLDKTRHIIDQIRHHDAQLAKALAELMQEYRFDILQQVFENTLQEASDS